MPEDERLREALLELQVLRDREARTLTETKALLECLEAYTSASDAHDALVSVFRSMQKSVGADRTLLVTKKSTRDVVILASDRDQDIGTQISPPINIFIRARNLSDLNLLGPWPSDLDLSRFSGAIIVPASDNIALITLRNAPGSFRNDNMHLVERLAGLAVQALQNSQIASENELLAATIAGSSAGFAIADATKPDRPLVYVNAAFEKISGYAADDVIGSNCRFLMDEAPDHPERIRLREAVKELTSGTFLLRNRRKSGELFWNELTLYPVMSSNGDPQHLVATQRDVTERVEATAERDRLQERMVRALSETEDAFLVLEKDGQIAFANKAVNRMFPVPDIGWQTGTTFSQNWSGYIAESEDLPGQITSLLRSPPLTKLVELPSGHEIDLPDGKSVLLRAGKLDEGGLVLSATDVTAMKSARQLLSQRLAAIEAATDGIAVTDEEGRLIYQNAAAAALMGFGAATSGLGQRWQSQYIYARNLDFADAFEAIFDRKSVEPTQVHQISGSPISSGGSVIIIRNITEDIEAEARENELMRELERLQRQEAIAQLTAGVAHDFNNLLAAINGSATLIGMNKTLPNDVRPHLKRISAAGSQSAKLISRLLDIGAASDAEGVFELSSVLADLPSILQTNLPRRVKFTIETTGSAVLLKGAPTTLSQILINMAMNAGDAIGTKPGSIQLNVRTLKGSEASNIAIGELASQAQYICLSMWDTGDGMDPETASNIFRPYFTTKGREGTGLGLATSAMQVQSVGGAIGLQTEVGKGTTLEVYWPLHQQVPHTQDTGDNQGSNLAGQMIIVVDDDLNVAEVTGSYLEACGAEVAVCVDPRDALEAIEDDPTSWSALITDYDMPIMNGGEMVEKAHIIAPDLPIFVVTALAKRLSDPRIIDGQVAGIYSKPVELERLTQALAASVISQ